MRTVWRRCLIKTCDVTGSWPSHNTTTLAWLYGTVSRLHVMHDDSFGDISHMMNMLICDDKLHVWRVERCDISNMNNQIYSQFHRQISKICRSNILYHLSIICLSFVCHSSVISLSSLYHFSILFRCSITRFHWIWSIQQSSTICVLISSHLIISHHFILHLLIT